MPDVPNIFALSQDAFKKSYDQANVFRQDLASRQAGTSIADGDYQGGANALNRAGMIGDAQNVQTRQLALEDRKTAATNLAQDRALKVQQIQNEGLDKLANTMLAQPQGTRSTWLHQNLGLIQGLGLPAEKFAGLSEDRLSDGQLNSLRGLLAKQREDYSLGGVRYSGTTNKPLAGVMEIDPKKQIYAVGEGNDSPLSGGTGGPSSQPAPAEAMPSPRPTGQTAAPATARPAAPVNASPQDVDALAQMMVTEAGGDGPDGMIAVAHVALNRLRSNYGGSKSLTDVVTAPNQFEGMKNAANVHPQDLARARYVAQQVLSGQVPDPTNGATQFLNPELQTQLGRQQPAWANGQGLRLGRHVFYNRGAAPQAAQGSDALSGGPGTDTATPANIPGMHLVSQPRPEWQDMGDGRQRNTFTGKIDGQKEVDDAPLSKEAVDMNATRVAMTGVMPTMGMGKGANANRTAIQNRAAEMIKEWGVKPEDWVTGVAQFKIAQGSLGKISQTRNMVQASENAVVANMNTVVLPLMAKAQPGRIPFLNKYTMAVKDQAFGDPDVKAYDNALHTVADEYAKVMTTTNGAGGAPSSDSARQEAYRRLSTAQTGPQLQETFRTLQAEMANRRSALVQQEQALTAQLRGGLAPGGSVSPTSAPSTQAPPAAAPGGRKSLDQIFR